jgi:hypothetical protein
MDYLLVILVIFLVVIVIFTKTHENYTNPVGFSISNFTCGSSVPSDACTNLTNNFNNNTYGSSNVFQMGNYTTYNNKKYYYVNPYGNTGWNVSYSNQCFSSRVIGCNVCISEDDYNSINSLSINGVYSNCTIYLISTNNDVKNSGSKANITRVK